LVPAQGTTAGPSSRSSTTATAREGLTTTRASDSSGTNTTGAGGGSSLTDSDGSRKSGLSTGAIAGIAGGAVLVIIGIALIAGGVWWGFKKGQRMGRERRDIVENLASAPEYTVGGQSSGGGDPGEEDLVGVGAPGKPSGTVQAAEVYGTEGRRERGWESDL